MNRLQSLMRFSSRSWLDDYSGNPYPLFGLQQTLGGKVEEMPQDFPSQVAYAYQSNGIVFACMLARMMLFTEARFQFRRLRSGRPGDLFANPDLRLLERPWSGGTTGDLLKYLISDADLSGNAFITRRGAGPTARLVRLRPDWVTIVMGSQSNNLDVEAGDLDAEIVGYVYHPGGRYFGREAETLRADQVAHFAPIPDPLASYRGMSWLTPVLREIMGDSAMTSHKLRYFEQGATPNFVVSLDIPDPVKFREWTKVFEQDHTGIRNAYKTFYLGGGADAKVVGSSLKDIDYKAVMGAGETRIASAAGVPPVVVGLSEGLQGSSLNAGNFASSMRRFADLTMRPLWRNVCGSLERIIPTPGDAQLWFDDRDVPALKDDIKDAAEVQALQSTAIRTLTDGGYDAESVVDAIVSGDLKRLTHTGLLSVQLNPPNKEQPKEEPGAIPEQLLPFAKPNTPSGNGKNTAAEALAPLMKKGAD
jgi:phage portal protein BeeE